MQLNDEHLKNITHVTYNFSEAGHGKSAADGVGAVVKRTADNLVACGNDICNYEAFVIAMKARLKTVFFETVSEKDITDVDMHIPSKLTTFVGTMKVHQWTWNRENYNCIMFRLLSCYNCDSAQRCKHFHLGTWTVFESQPKPKRELRKSKRLKR